MVHHHRIQHRMLKPLMILGSLLLTLTDYTSVVTSPSDPLYGMPSADNGSWRNLIVEFTEPFFSIAFALECMLKVVAMGFCLDEHSYLRSDGQGGSGGWNMLDFIVVVASILGFVPGVANFSGAGISPSSAALAASGRAGASSTLAA